jgi:clan AA aspartic protease (TIGR02281 family)
MLSWALRYVAVAVAVAIAFAALQGSDWLELPRHERSKGRSIVGEHGRSVPMERARRVGSEGWVEEDGQSDTGEEDGWAADDSWANDDGSAAEDGWASDDGSAADDGWDGTTPEDDAEAEATDGLLELVIRAWPRGHFVVDAEVEGTPLTFLVDTGASDVVLSPDDARRLGLEPRTLDYSREYQTANGVVRAAPVTLRELRLGQLQLYDLDASVNERPLPMSLLGMSFLDRLQSYEVTDGRLVLRW